MKKLLYVVTLCILLPNLANSNTNKSIWGYAGFHFGPSTLESDVENEAGQKLGNQLGIQFSGVYNSDNWALNSTLSWFQLNSESEFVDGRKVELATRTFAVEVSPLWKPHHRWYIGPKLSYVIGDEIIVGPGSGNTTNKIAGLNVFYEIPWKNTKIRNGFHFHQLLDTGDRNSKVILYSLEIGQLFFQNSKEVNVAKEQFTQKPTQTIQLDEQIVNFNQGSSELTQESQKFLIDLGSVLRDITNDWEIIKIEGHTDTTGSAKRNMKISQDRVNAVISALNEGGAPKDRIAGEAFGESMPISNDNTPEAHAINRRVELGFLGKTNGEKIKNILQELLSN